jgi:hypothetical protein
VWKFDAPQSRDTASGAHHLVVHDELAMLRSLAGELVQVVRDQRALLVACEKENMALQTALKVQTVQAASQTEVVASSVKMEGDAAAAEKRDLELTVLDLRRQLLKADIDHRQQSATKHISHLEQELAAMADQALQKEAEYAAHARRLQALDLEQQQALREALDARSEFELKNAILHELVQQLEISNTRAEAEARALAERHSSLQVALGAMEERAVNAEQQRSLLLHNLNVELQSISSQSTLY